MIEHRYNGLDFRLGWHGDADADGTVESNFDDPWYFVTYDPSWRAVATLRAGDTNAKELLIPQASSNVRGLDGIILRDKDASGGWNAATDGVREERAYYCQNDRGDVVQLIWSTVSGPRRCESVRYSAFGVPTAIASDDFDGDGDEDSEDSDFMLAYFDVHPPAYSVVADLDLDGDIDEDDDALQLLTSGGGRGLLSTSGVGNRRGYAGYEHDWAIDALCHVRHRAHLTEHGRWTRRDPLGYVEGMSLYAYVANRAVVRTDGMGLLGSPMSALVGSPIEYAPDEEELLNPGPTPKPTPVTPCGPEPCLSGGCGRQGGGSGFPEDDDICKEGCRLNRSRNGLTVCYPTTHGDYRLLCCICDENIANRYSAGSRSIVEECANANEQYHMTHTRCPGKYTERQKACEEWRSAEAGLACMQRHCNGAPPDMPCKGNSELQQYYDSLVTRIKRQRAICRGQ